LIESGYCYGRYGVVTSCHYRNGGYDALALTARKLRTPVPLRVDMAGEGELAPAKRTNPTARPSHARQHSSIDTIGARQYTLIHPMSVRRISQCLFAISSSTRCAS